MAFPDRPVSPQWRYILLSLVGVYEMLFLLNPSPAPAATSSISSALFADPALGTQTSLFSALWPRRVAYQHVRFLHSLFVLCSFALSNIVPVLFPSPTPEMQEQWITNEAKQILLQANAISQEGAPWCSSPHTRGTLTSLQQQHKCRRSCTPPTAHKARRSRSWASSRPQTTS